MSQYQNNPNFKRAQEMAQGKSPQEIQQIAMNLCQQRGVDFNTMQQQFQSFMNRKG